MSADARPLPARPADAAAPWRQAAARGLDTSRRGAALATAAGVVLLSLHAISRAGLGATGLPELRSLLGYDDLVLHGALWLGLLLHTAGLAFAGAALPARRDRWVLFGLAGLSAVAMLLVCLAARPGSVPVPDGPAPGAPVLGAAALGAVAVASGLLGALQVSAASSASLARLRGHLPPLAGLLVTATLAVSESAGQLLPLGPRVRLGVTAATTMLALGAVLWLAHVQSEAAAALRRWSPDETPSRREALPLLRSGDLRATPAPQSREPQSA